MAAAAHKRIAIQGLLLQTAGGGQDIFEFTLADSSGLSLADTAGHADTVTRNQWGSGTFSLGISEYAEYNSCRVEAIDGSGKVTNSYFLQSYNAIPGTSVSNTCTILSHAVTLETGAINSRGRKVRGRFYPPAYFPIEGATGSLSDAQSYATHWAGYISALNAAGLVISVASSTSAGLVPVTGCSVDTVIDTQRRRKNRVTSQRSNTVAV